MFEGRAARLATAALAGAAALVGLLYARGVTLADHAGSLLALTLTFAVGVAAVGTWSSRASTRLQRRERRRRLFRLIGLACALLAGELLATVAFKTSLTEFESARGYLLGEQRSEQARYLRQPLLVYTGNPDYVSPDGVTQHNPQGFRGAPVPVARRSSHKRVLFLGGSTTYSVKVARPEESYPAQVGALLNAELPEGTEGVEVINGGYGMMTSAELLTHYQFKWSYFRPDVVVINAGGNDTVPFERGREAFVQPDYSHWRRQPFYPNPLSSLGRLLVRSRLFAFCYLLVGRVQGESAALVRDKGPAPVRWYPGFNAEVSNDPSLLPFRRNLDALIRLAQLNGAKVLLVPFRRNPTLAPNLERDVGGRISVTEAALIELGEAHSCALAPFPAEVIPEASWVDFCHLDAQGCRKKAEHIAPFVRRLLFD